MARSDSARSVALERNCSTLIGAEESTVILAFLVVIILEELTQAPLMTGYRSEFDPTNARDKMGQSILTREWREQESSATGDDGVMTMTR